MGLLLRDPGRPGGADRMAELTAPDTTEAAGCCAPAAQATCCEPSEKAACCETSAAGGSCGCAAGQTAVATDADALRETVRERYAAAALATADPTAAAGCCGPGATDHRAVRRRPVRRRRARRAARHGAARIAGLRQPDRHGRAARGRDRARPRFRRRHRRAALRPPRRPQRHRLWPRYDRRDARPRQGQPGQGRDRERALAQGPYRSHPAPRRDRRRRPLQLRHQPLHRQAAGPARDRSASSSPAAGSPSRT